MKSTLRYQVASFSGMLINGMAIGFAGSREKHEYLFWFGLALAVIGNITIAMANYYCGKQDIKNIAGIAW